jgi:hypothetical protein
MSIRATSRRIGWRGISKTPKALERELSEGADEAGCKEAPKQSDKQKST